MTIQPSAVGTLAETFFRDGFVHPVDVLDEDETLWHRRQLEQAEARRGGSMHYVVKPHLLFPSAGELLRHRRLLDGVEDVLGPDILAYESSYIIKEAHSARYVSWHQDLTYWGLDTDEVITAWLALTEVTAANGAMRMLPGSHKSGARPHLDERDPQNILSRGQRVAGVEESSSVHVELRPGQMSLHHGWTLHTSGPNATGDRRIGFSVIFITPRVRQRVSQRESAVLCRGEDRHGHYDPEPVADTAFDPVLMALQQDIDRRRKALWQTA